MQVRLVTVLTDRGTFTESLVLCTHFAVLLSYLHSFSESSPG